MKRFPPRFFTDTQRSLPPLCCEEVYTAIDSIFKEVSKADVHQKSGQMHLNANEITCEGVTMLVKMVENISRHDVFLDVGSGIGNVIAQIALQTPVRFSYGVEIRKDVLTLSKKLIAKHITKYPGLSKVWQIDQDICRLSEVVVAKLRKVTILYSSNQLFEEDAKLGFRDLIAKMANLRVLVVASKFCPRH